MIMQFVLWNGCNVNEMTVFIHTLLFFFVAAALVVIVVVVFVSVLYYKSIYMRS